ncbi:hypothetical protein BX600DRAFT_510766 [Xylariales sp. PMI_506]|nr:hypothetical protein BX600DRAFT_510766 [Xylariales sp. PMI_506]
MQFKLVTLPLLAAVATAASNQTLTELVSQLPTCALSCFETGAAAANCTTTDFACLCGTGSSVFKQSAGICLLTGGDCSTNETSSVETLAGEICSEVNDNPSSTDVASASALVASEIASATSSNFAAATPAVGFGIMGAAAVAAFAL